MKEVTKECPELKEIEVMYRLKTEIYWLQIEFIAKLFYFDISILIILLVGRMGRNGTSGSDGAKGQKGEPGQKGAK